jgi:hypothetical protein
MTEPLLVDSSRLETAGNKLRGLVLPAPPPPIVATGTDSVSAAINETLPIIESPVIDGLRDAKTALTKTGSNIATAAGMYAETDQRLGDHLSGVQFLAAGEKPAGGATTDQTGQFGQTASAPAAVASQVGQVASQVGQAAQLPPVPPQLEGVASQVGQVAPQVSQMAGTVSPLAQNVSQVSQSISQSVQGAAGGMSGGGTPAQLADNSTKTEQSPADQAQLVDETKTEKDQQPEALAEGAASGDQTSEGVPAESLTPGRTETTPSAVEL